MDDLTRLALAARDGDRAALAAFIRRAQPDVWRLCAHLTSWRDADDVTQDVFVRAIGAMRSFRGESSARTWMLAIARNACADHLRRTARRRNLERRIDPPEQSLPDPGAAVALDQLLRTLDTDRRTALVLTQLLGLSYEEAAEVCRCPIGTIRSRVSRARADLVAAMAADAAAQADG
jgi:RNA polymerase sigma-70 factor (ECF subfamily)